MNSQDFFFFLYLNHLARKKLASQKSCSTEKYKHFIQKMCTLYYIYIVIRIIMSQKFYEKIYQYDYQELYKSLPKKTGQEAVKI